jgi:GntR family transcriptional regulator, transcriptional repressor for pyruvate dehydrogenase complex
MSFARVRPPLRMSEAIARQIEEQVYRGQLLPNQMLPSENELMKQFGVGRNTIREAFRMLEASGLLRIRQGSRGGSFITHMSNEFVSDFLMKALRLGGVSAASFHTFRSALEPSIAAMVAQMDDIDPVIISQMDDNISKAKAVYESHGVTALVNMDFHVLLAEATKNIMFIVIMKTLRAGLTEVAPAEAEVMRSETIEYHERILDAIKRRDSAGAREQMRLHLAQTESIVRMRDFSRGGSDQRDYFEVEQGQTY